MNRLFGTKSSAPKPTLDSAIQNASITQYPLLSPPPTEYQTDNRLQVDSRVSNLDIKLAALNAELSTYQTKISKMRDGPGKSALRQKALKVLQRRKQYEAQRDQLSQQSWNMEQAGMMQDNLRNVMTTVDAMKTTTKTLKQQYGKVDIDKIERMQDEMQDLMDIGNEIQESISRAYDVPEDVDEAELDAELEALGEEAMFESSLGEEAMPSFMQDEVAPPQFIDEPPEQSKVKEAAGGVG
ncbi:Vacuolar protein-sorting-associated protein 60 [Emydomyces testavorans]|uniref:Vacuolar protein-sorting-associated protein 60 n=1 Tax=Emydomyces testavorans TaxID=2070801 RepID=A0AAF0IKC0_9EURO|nr:Vacuolar protein-sorting-associated protein 60 [Emydomyces testavorans]